MTEAQAVVYILVGFMALAGTVGAAVLGARQKGLTDLVGALQDEVASLRERADKNAERIARLEGRERRLINYVHRLRAHIVQQLPPPPPEWPADLDL